MDKAFRKLARFQTFDGRKEFQSRVVDLLRKKVRGYSDIRPANDPDLIYVGDGRIQISELRKMFLNTAQTKSDLDALTGRFADMILSIGEYNREDWETARPYVHPILINRQKTSSLMVTLPFAGDVAVALVRDHGSSFRYLTNDDLENWGKTPDELFGLAKHNLEVSAEIIPVAVVSGPSKVCFFRKGDSYDAARILLPNMRKLLFETFGREFCFGIPNRDFMVCWETGASRSSHLAILNSITEQFKTEPYGISRFGYVMGRDGVIRKFTVSTLK